MATLAELGQRVKAKYPGQYDDLSDVDLARKVQAKYPGQYDDFTDGPPMMASHEAPKAAAPPGRLESAARGALQGVTMGFGDEAAGALAAAVPALDSEAAGRGNTFAERYRSARDFYRNRNAAAQKSHPGTYLTTEIVGGAAPAVAAGVPATGAKALALAAGQGAAQGAGYSDASSGQQLASDTALGGALGVAGYGAGKVLGKAADAVRRSGADRAGLGAARAGTQAAGEVAEQIGSARGELGAEVQKGSRYVENLMRLRESMTPEQQALYSQLEASGVVPGLQQAVAQSTLERLPSQAATIAGKQGALDALTKAAPDLARERTQQLLTPQVGADAKSFLKSYAEPLVAAYLANKAAEAAGGDMEARGMAAGAAGLIFGRTRAGKALMTRLTRPAHQFAIGKGIEGAAEKIGPALAPVAASVASSPVFLDWLRQHGLEE